MARIRMRDQGFRLSDRDIYGLVQLQDGARAARMRPYEMARYRGQGRSVAYVVADKHGRPYRGHGKDKHHSDGGRERNRDRDYRPNHHRPHEHD